MCGCFCAASFLTCLCRYKGCCMLRIVVACVRAFCPGHSFLRQTTYGPSALPVLSSPSQARFLLFLSAPAPSNMGCTIPYHTPGYLVQRPVEASLATKLSGVEASRTSGQDHPRLDLLLGITAAPASIASITSAHTISTHSSWTLTDPLRRTVRHSQLFCS